MKENLKMSFSAFNKGQCNLVVNLFDLCCAKFSLLNMGHDSPCKNGSNGMCVVNSKYTFFLGPSYLTYVLGTQKNRLIETVLLSTHNIRFG